MLLCAQFLCRGIGSSTLSSPYILLVYIIWVYHHLRLFYSRIDTLFFLWFRGLFEQHKLVFSFMLCADIMKQNGDITNAEWNFFLRGSAAVDKVRTCIWNHSTCSYACWYHLQERPVSPDIPWLTQQIWNTCCDMEDELPCFKGILKDFVCTPVGCKIGRIEVLHGHYYASVCMCKRGIR